MTAINRHDLTIIRGDNFWLYVGLAGGFDEIINDPDLYEVRLEFRVNQDDSQPAVFTKVDTPVNWSEPRFPEVDLLADLSLTPAETQALPTYPLVFFCEVRSLTGDFVRRLFEGRVRKRD